MDACTRHSRTAGGRFRSTWRLRDTVAAPTTHSSEPMVQSKSETSLTGFSFVRLERTESTYGNPSSSAGVGSAGTAEDGRRDLHDRSAGLLLRKLVDRRAAVWP